MKPCCVQVSYLKLIKYWEWELRYKSAEEKAAAEHQVPPYIQRAQPAISTHWWVAALGSMGPKPCSRSRAVSTAAWPGHAMRGMLMLVDHAP
jgi:hypothetical protein